MEVPPDELASQIQSGNAAALSRGISLCEVAVGYPEREEYQQLESLLTVLEPPKNPPLTVGFTGPPGVGKSTLIGALLAEGLSAGDNSAVLAVDPSSHRSGGAVLGDRLRMLPALHAGGDRVYMRSMSSQGHLGGTALAAALALDLLEAANKDYIFVETVGAGQSEFEISNLVELTILVDQPGTGDGLQAMKSGIIEAADVICINKCDQTHMLGSKVMSLRAFEPLFKTQATNPEDVGVHDLTEYLAAIRASTTHEEAYVQTRDRRQKTFVRNLVAAHCLKSATEATNAFYQGADTASQNTLQHARAVTASLKMQS